MKRGMRAVVAVTMLILLTASMPVNSESTPLWYGHLTWQGRGEYLAELDFLAGFGAEGLTCVDPSSGEDQTCTGANGLPGFRILFFRLGIFKYFLRMFR